MVVVAAVVFVRFTEVGLNEHEIPIVAYVLHEKVAVLVRLFKGVIVSNCEPVWPPVIVRLTEFGANEKSGSTTVTKVVAAKDCA